MLKQLLPILASLLLIQTPVAGDLYRDELPDLVITDIWHEGEIIYYQVMNRGGSPSPPGHSTGLLVDGDYRVSQIVNVELPPGERWISRFEYSWICTPPSDQITVWADFEDGLGAPVDEENEENNSRIETWKCLDTPPVITYGPEIRDLATSSVLIAWETDRETEGVVSYGRIARLFTEERGEPGFATDHAVNLTGLEPGSVYHFIVESWDPHENRVTSPEIFFETPPLTDSEPPELWILDAGTSVGLSKIKVEAWDNRGIEKVTFSLDDNLLFTDYSPPWEFILNTTRYDNGIYSLNVRALDPSLNPYEEKLPFQIGNTTDPDKPEVKITYPVKDQAVSGSINVKATISDDKGLLFGWFKVDGNWGGTWYPKISGAKSENVKFPWNTLSETNGKHRIAFEIYDLDMNSGIGTQDVVVNNTAPPKPPELVVKRKVTRTGTYFTVELTVENKGGLAARKVRLRDYLQLFQPISRTFTNIKYEASFRDELSRWEMYITDQDAIQPGQTRVYTYEAVPVLLYPVILTPMIGGDKYADFLDLWYEPPDGSEIYNKRPKIASIETKSWGDALKASDYLIVTSPGNLLLFSSSPEVNRLLSSMAELARIRGGVLGFLDVPSTLARNIEAHDGFDMGDVGDDFRAELVLGDQDSNEIHVYHNSDYWYHFKPGTTSFDLRWTQMAHFKCGYQNQGFDQGDGLSVGDLPGGTKSEIVMADHSSNRILIYNGKGTLLKSFSPGDIESFDGLAVGNVTGDAKEEIIFGDRSSGRIFVYNYWGVRLDDFSINLEAHDGLAAGDVWGNDRDEIILADKSADTIYILSSDGSLCGTFKRTFDQGDGMAAGNAVKTWPSDKDEIIITDKSEQKILILKGDGALWKSIEGRLGNYDRPAVGDVTGSGGGEIVTTDWRNNCFTLYSMDRLEGQRYLLDQLTCYFPSALKTIFKISDPRGAWSEKLKSDWTSNGYLLIVGETEIVPAWGGFEFGKLYTNIGNIMIRSDCTDFPYASTYGSEIKPELAAGRIVGNSALELRQNIETFIHIHKGTAGYGFDRTSYFAVSGFPKALSGKAGKIDFKSELFDACLTMQKKGVHGVVMFTPDYTKYSSPGVIDEKATKAAILGKFFAHTPDRDVIFLAGHGNASSWDVIGINNILEQGNTFGSKNPFIYASSCTTGRYVDGLCVGEAFLREKAAVFLGATKHGLSTHSAISNKFYYNWDTGESIGLGVKQTKRGLGGGTSDRYYSAIYHLFGDPKFGTRGPTISESSRFSRFDEPPPFVEIHVPPWEAKICDEGHCVSIPGGDLLLEPGMSGVPFYTEYFEFPNTFRVRDVIMIHRSDPETSTGLSIPPTRIVVDGSGRSPAFTDYEFEGWWPEREFEWELLKGPETTTLAVRVFPFYYNPLTTEVRFHSHYEFEIVSLETDLEILSLETEKSVFDPEQQVPIHIVIRNNSGEERDVLVSVSIEREGTGDLFDGILLHSLKGLSGTAVFTPVWDSTGAPPGFYTMQAELRDGDGALLDTGSLMFRIGSVSGDITDFSGSPRFFHPGDPVDFALEFTNTGSSPTSGTAHIRIKNDAGEEIDDFQRDFPPLAPGDVDRFEQTWDTTGTDEESFVAVGYVFYEGRVAASREIVIRSKPLSGFKTY